MKHWFVLANNSIPFANYLEAKLHGLQGDGWWSAFLLATTLESTDISPAFGSDPAPLMPQQLANVSCCLCPLLVEHNLLSQVEFCNTIHYFFEIIVDGLSIIFFSCNFFSYIELLVALNQLILFCVQLLSKHQLNIMQIE